MLEAPMRSIGDGARRAGGLHQRRRRGCCFYDILICLGGGEPVRQSCSGADNFMPPPSAPGTITLTLFSKPRRPGGVFFCPALPRINLADGRRKGWIANYSSEAVPIR